MTRGAGGAIHPRLTLGGALADISIYHNPRCSKSREALGLLREQDIDPHIVEYLKDNPTRADVEQLMRLLGIKFPKAMMRTNEPAFRELALGDANDDELIDAMVAHPILIERPIIIKGDRAVIGRPPKRVLELLELPD
jgi:arsenate reductase (glutaredoxin)